MNLFLSNGIRLKFDFIARVFPRLQTFLILSFLNLFIGMAYNNLQQLMGMGGAAYANIQQQSLQGRNPYQAGYPPNSQAMAGHPGYPGMVNSGYPQVTTYMLK